MTSNIKHLLISTESYIYSNPYWLRIYSDMHTVEDLERIRDVLLLYKPEYFLCEFLLDDRVMNKKEAKIRIDKAGRGEKCDPYFNISYYRMAVDVDIPFIGIDLDVRYVMKDKEKLKESFRIREARMVEVINEFRVKGNVVVFVGDTHLRTIATNELGPISPIQKEFSKIATIIRNENGEIK